MSVVKEQLVRYAEELNYDDKDDGCAVRAFRQDLLEIANHAEELESLGFAVTVDCKPVQLGGAGVEVQKDGVEIVIYSQFYDTFSYGFCPGLLDNINTIRARVDAAKRWAADPEKRNWKTAKKARDWFYWEKFCHCKDETLMEVKSWPHNAGGTDMCTIDPVAGMIKCWGCGRETRLPWHLSF